MVQCFRFHSQQPAPLLKQLEYVLACKVTPPTVHLVGAVPVLVPSEEAPEVHRRTHSWRFQQQRVTPVQTTRHSRLPQRQRNRLQQSDASSSSACDWPLANIHNCLTDIAPPPHIALFAIVPALEQSVQNPQQERMTKKALLP